MKHNFLRRTFSKKLMMFLVAVIILPVLSFTDSSQKNMVDVKVIKKGFDTYYEAGKINVKFKNDVIQSAMDKFGITNLDGFLSAYSVSKVYQRHPLKKDKAKRMIGDEELAKIYTIVFDKSVDPVDFSNDILKQFSSMFDWAEPSFVYKCDFIPNDPVIGSQWHIQKINAYQAWDICQGDTSVVVGIVDSGTDFDHPDLAANIRRNWNENPTNGVDDDNNGYIDDYRGWDFWGSDNDPSIKQNGNVHGSHVSGCVDQVANNGIHGAGIGYKVKIMMTKHTDDTNPESLLYNTDQGIAYCYQNGAKVINCSFGSASYSSYSQQIINSAWANGTVICASAGNGDANGVGQNWARYPASYDNVVSVAATDNNDTKTSFSNYHSTVDICSPGQNILSTVVDYSNGIHSYTYMDGTSMSSPIVAGTVALIRSKHPEWSAQQVVDRLKLGVDSIYNLNPAYVGLLGTGRVNAFKCLSDLPILKIVSYLHNDSIYGNNDKVYDVNEVIPIAITFKNTFIAGSNTSIRLTTTDPDIEIVQDSVYLGAVPAFNNISTTFGNTFKVKAKATCSFDKDVTFKVSNSASCYTDNSANTFVIRFRQGIATHNVNSLKLGLTIDGAIGKKAQAYGTGLLIGNGTVNQIYEAGLMIGISNTQVSDVSRRGTTPANVSDTDFTPINAYTLTTPGIVSAQDGNGKFNDNGAGTNKIGVEVTSESFAFTGANDSNYILIRYTIRNTNSYALNNLYAGIFSFFSPSGSYFAGNITRYDSQNKLGYSFNSTTPNPYVGTALLTGQSANFKAITFNQVLDGFTTAEKWASLSSGIVSDSAGPGGFPFTIAAGPINIPASQTVKVGFAIVKGNDLMDLRNNVNIARNKYNSVGINQVSSTVPGKYELNQNYPNPFNPVTKIKFAIKKNENVNIRIYDMLGREVSTLINQQLNAGFYELDFDGSALSSGMYFYKMTTNSFTDIKKMMLIK